MKWSRRDYSVLQPFSYVLQVCTCSSLNHCRFALRHSIIKIKFIVGTYFFFTLHKNWSALKKLSFHTSHIQRSRWTVYANFLTCSAGSCYTPLTQVTEFIQFHPKIYSHHLLALKLSISTYIISNYIFY